jgi:hypothetical protein
VTPKERDRPAGNGNGLGNTIGISIVPPTADIAVITSRQVSWWSVHEFVAGRLEVIGSWPMVGTPEWCALPDDDPRKLAALFDAARHWALRVETCQQAEADASHDISAAVDWSAIGAAMRSHNEFYAQRPWLKRRVS